MGIHTTNHRCGVRRVKNHKQQNRISAAIVSMSLGGPRSASLNDAVEDLARAGIVTVVAAGKLTCSSTPWQWCTSSDVLELLGLARQLFIANQL